MARHPGRGDADLPGLRLVLTALTFSRVSYVAPTREVGIVFAVLLGGLLLHERVGAGRLLGSSLIVVGLVIIAVSP